METKEVVRLLFTLVLTSFLSLSANTLNVIDLTYPLGTDALFWPGSPPFNLTPLQRGYSRTGIWYQTNAFYTAEHGGTHFDAPVHFSERGWKAEQIPEANLVGEGVVVDVQRQVQSNADYQLTKDDLLQWEEIHGPIPRGAVVIMNSGWGNRYPEPEKVFNTAYINNASTFHFPGFGVDAARYLAEKYVHAVGGDTPSPDSGQNSLRFPVHIMLSSRNIIILENVANVYRLPPKGALILIGAVKLREGTGGPVRLLALENFCLYNSDHSSACALQLSLTILLSALLSLALNR